MGFVPPLIGGNWDIFVLRKLGLLELEFVRVLRPHALTVERTPINIQQSV